jgi:uncharacterized beta-barrel protein YwiB (DUF1934 family)
MKKQINLKIKSIIDYEDQDDETIEITTEGEIYVKRDKTYITYEESEISGMENSKTVLVINNDEHVEMIRFGTINSKMHFKLNEQTNTRYKTQYGNFQMVIMTNIIDNTINFDTEEGILILEYRLHVKGLSKSRNHLKISIV